MPGCPLHRSNPPAAAPRGAGAARERRGSGAGAALVGSQRGTSQSGRGCRRNAGASQSGRRRNAGASAVKRRAPKAVKAVRPSPTRRAGAPAHGPPLRDTAPRHSQPAAEIAALPNRQTTPRRRNPRPARPYLCATFYGCILAPLGGARTVGPRGAGIVAACGCRAWARRRQLLRRLLVT